MNAWQIVLFALAVIAGITAYGCGMVATLRTGTPILETLGASPSEKLRRFPKLLAIFYAAILSVFLVPDRYQAIAETITLTLAAVGALSFAYRVLAQPHSRGWAVGALVSGTVSVACLHFALH